MYLADSLETRGKQVAGPLTLWHYHPRSNAKCFRKRISSISNELEKMNCRKDSPKMFRGPEMIHVWFIIHPEGQFSSRMDLPTEANKRYPQKMSRQKFIQHTNKTYQKYYKAEK
jgi:hypothetical protein